MLTKFWSENLRGRDHLEHLSTDCRSVRMDLRERGWEDMDYISLAQDTNQQQAFVNM